MTPVVSLAKRMLGILDVPEQKSVWQWAEENRFMSPEYCATPQMYRASFAPFQKEPQEAFHDPDVQEVVVMCASQLMKTTILENLVGYHIDHDPAPILMVQPTVEMAETWSKTRLATTIRDSINLRNKVSSPKSRDSGNTILAKQFYGGDIALVGANSPAGLAARSRRVILLDEVDRFPKSAGREGDPCALAIRRAESFFNAVIVYTSTPTIKGESRIEAQFLQTDQRYWFCPCAACGLFQTLKWEQVRWVDGDERNGWYQCEGCGDKWNDEKRIEAVFNGEWRPTAPFNGSRGYHINGIASPFMHHKGYANRIHEMIVGYQKAKASGEDAIRSWTNTFLAKTYERKYETPELVGIMKRCEDYKTELPEGVLVLTMAVDTQGDRLEVEVKGWGLGREGWAIERYAIAGSPFNVSLWRQFDERKEKEYAHPIAGKMKPAIVLIDSGGTQGERAFADPVYQYVGPRQGMERGPGIYAIKGSSTPGAPLVRHRNLQNGIFLKLIGTDGAKGAVYGMLGVNQPGPRYQHFPVGSGYDEEHFKQLMQSEVQENYKRNGFTLVRWVKVRDRNEGLDLSVYHLAALEVLNADFRTLAKRLEAIKPKDFGAQPVPVNPPKPPPVKMHVFNPRRIMRRRPQHGMWRKMR